MSQTELNFTSTPESAPDPAPDTEGNNQLGNLYLTFIVDRSGSMMSCGVAVFEGIRGCIEKKVKFAEEQKLRVVLTIFTFDDKIERLKIPDDPAQLKTEHYEIIKRGVEPRGWTRLYDTIHQAAKYTTTLQEEHNQTNSRGFMVIITDGDDNQSDMTQEDLKKEVESHKKTGMEYIFIGANIDARRTGSTLGISKDACMQFSPDPELTQNAFSSIGMAIQRSIETDDQDFQFSKLERFTSCNAKDRKHFNVDAGSLDDHIKDFTSGLPSLIPGDEVPDMNDVPLWASPGRPEDRDISRFSNAGGTTRNLLSSGWGNEAWFSTPLNTSDNTTDGDIFSRGIDDLLNFGKKNDDKQV